MHLIVTRHTLQVVPDDDALQDTATASATASAATATAASAAATVDTSSASTSSSETSSTCTSTLLCAPGTHIDLYPISCQISLCDAGILYMYTVETCIV
jgi:hypothetical protein